MKILFLLFACAAGAGASEFDKLVDSAVAAGGDSRTVIPLLIEAVKVWEPADKKERLSAACSDLGMHLVGVGETKEAETFFARAVALDPGKSTPRVNHGFTLGALGRIEEAIGVHAAVFRADPDNTTNLQNFCVVLMNSDEFARARPYCERNVVLAPDEAHPLLNMARVYAELGRHEEAARAIAAAATKRSRGTIEENSRAYELLPRLQEAYVGSLAGRWDEGEADFKRLIEENPKIPLPLALRGLARLRRGHWDGAIDDFDKAYALNPQAMIFVLIQRANAHMKAGRKAMAAEARGKACAAGWRPACPKKRKRS